MKSEIDEHRLGLKPIIPKIWAKVGQRPVAEIEPGYDWTYLYRFVHPATGKTEWLILPRVRLLLAEVPPRMQRGASGSASGHRWIQCLFSVSSNPESLR
jgi:hypothetical protein